MKVACIYNKLLLAKAGTTASGEPLKSNQSSCLCNYGTTMTGHDGTMLTGSDKQWYTAPLVWCDMNDMNIWYESNWIDMRHWCVRSWDATFLWAQISVPCASRPRSQTIGGRTGNARVRACNGSSQPKSQGQGQLRTVPKFYLCSGFNHISTLSTLLNTFQDFVVHQTWFQKIQKESSVDVPTWELWKLVLQGQMGTGSCELL